MEDGQEKGVQRQGFQDSRVRGLSKEARRISNRKKITSKFDILSEA
jgi:hypothetical protein